MDVNRISGKDLGHVSLPNFCPRCFWVQRLAPAGLPFQVFPGIFSSIDSYSKHVVHSWFDRNSCAPPWLADLGNIVGYLDPPHHTKFFMDDEETGIRLTGAPDAVFRLGDGSLMIGDYKTAKFTGTQDKLLPVYVTQLNAYALIAEAIGLGTVSRLALIYTEPVTDHGAANTDDVHRKNGFDMRFTSRIMPLELKTESIPPLLRRVCDIVENLGPPQRHPGCKNCDRLDGVVDLLAGRRKS